LAADENGERTTLGKLVGKEAGLDAPPRTFQTADAAIRMTKHGVFIEKLSGQNQKKR
jgi:hypothetical protein